MLTLLIYTTLIIISAIAKVEELISPNLLIAEKNWLIDYRFIKGSWFCKLCCQIPTQCPAVKIGLPPMCKLNPLYDQIMIMQLKATDPEHQTDWIELGHSM
ncbi:MAG: Mo-dependent nitrogenase C-terminal domain-containing protein [Candidatus Melainabacteria bacterium]|nr:Mo-dependent nitrogenase C-terminal domain-containing protein [Candidatus Melainabacteria bacterium]